MECIVDAIVAISMMWIINSINALEGFVRQIFKDDLLEEFIGKICRNTNR